MGNKIIKDLTALTTGQISDSDWLEIQEDDMNVTKKVTVSVLTEIERTARDAMDDAIIAGAGLETDGSLNINGTNYLDSATDIVDALETIDGYLKAHADLLTGIGGWITKKVTISNGEMKAIGVSDKTILATPTGANNGYEVFSVTANIKPVAAAFANGADVKITYTGESDALFTIPQAKINVATDDVIKGIENTTDPPNVEKAHAVVAKAASSFTDGDGTMDVYITYRLITFAPAGTP